MLLTAAANFSLIYIFFKFIYRLCRYQSMLDVIKDEDYYIIKNPTPEQVHKMYTEAHARIKKKLRPKKRKTFSSDGSPVTMYTHLSNAGIIGRKGKKNKKAKKKKKN